MSRSVAVVAYTIDLKSRREGMPRQFSLDGEFDAFSMLAEYFKSIRYQILRLGTPDPDTGVYSDPRGLKLQELKVHRDERRIDGVFYFGESGLLLPIVNMTTDEVVGELTKDQATVAPYYFSLWAEDNARRVCLLLQKSGTIGIKGMIEHDMKRHFRTDTESWVVKFSPLADMTAMSRFIEQGVLKDIVLINQGKAEESRKRLKRFKVDGKSIDEEDGGGRVTLRIQHPNLVKDAAKKIIGIATKARPVSDLVSAPGFDTYDEMKVEVERGGRTQVFSMTNPAESMFRFDITKDIWREPTGHPSLASLRRRTKEIYDDIRTLIG